MAWIQLGQDVNGLAANDLEGLSVAISSNGLVFATSSRFNDQSGTDRGEARVFAWNAETQTWVQRGSTIFGEADGDQVSSVALSSDGTILAVGSFTNDGAGSNSGHTRVYQWSNNTWTKLGSNINGEAADDQSALSVALSSDGTVVVIGARLNDGGGAEAGQVRVYTWNGTSWQKRGGDMDGRAAGDYFGTTVAISSDGTIIASGGYNNNSRTGYVTIYQWNGSSWAKIGSDINGTLANSDFGYGVALSSNGLTVASGGYTLDKGYIAIYDWNGSSWVQRGSNIAGINSNEQFGQVIYLSGDGTIVASVASNLAAGALRVYQWSNSTWTQLGSTITAESSGDLMVRCALSSDGSTVVAGSIFNDGNGTDSGSTRVFYYRTTPPAPTALSATSGNQQLTISFTPGDDGRSAITNYQYSIDNGSNFTAFSPATGAVSSVTITGLTNGQSYNIQLKAVNATGVGAASATVIGTPSTIPSAPTGLYTLTGDLQLTISFTQNDGGSPITNYQYSIDNGSNFTAFSPATGAVTSVTILGLNNGQTYNIQLKAINTNGMSSASATVTGTPASVTAAVENGPSGITDYIESQPVTNEVQKANITIDMRASIKAETFVDNATKAASQLAYIDAMRSQIGASSYTMPSSEVTAFLTTFTSVVPELDIKPVDVFYPTFVSQTATINLSSTSSSKYIHIEVPIGYSVVLQNGEASLTLTYNGTSYVDEAMTTYTTNTSIVLGNKTFTVIGIGSLGLDQINTSEVVCFNEGTNILTPEGNVPIESLNEGDLVITGTNEIKPILNIHKIVVVRANEINAPYIIEPNAFGTNCPPNQLIVSPRHAIQLNPGLWEIPREAAKENKLVYQNKAALGRKVIYYHITMPNYERDTLISNGQISDSMNNGKVKETYLWNKTQGGYVRHIEVVEKKKGGMKK
jgi:hypothetical protein